MMKKQKSTNVQAMADRSKSLQQLEGADWGDPPYPSYLVTTTYALRRKPIGEFTIEDLRIMLGQQIGAPFLVPLALEHLAADLLVSGDYYDGDLLNSVIRQDATFWQAYPHLHAALDDLFQRELAAIPAVETLADAEHEDVQARLIEVATAYERWQRGQSS
jgi:hypothetical protein